MKRFEEAPIELSPKDIPRLHRTLKQTGKRLVISSGASLFRELQRAKERQLEFKHEHDDTLAKAPHDEQGHAGEATDAKLDAVSEHATWDSSGKAALAEFFHAHIKPTIEQLRLAALKHGHTEDMADNVKLVLDEWLQNIPQHAHEGNLAKPIEIWYNFKKKLPVLMIIDRGKAPMQTQDRLSGKSAAKMESGRGLILTGALARIIARQEKTRHLAVIQMRPPKEVALIQAKNLEKLDIEGW